MPWLISAVGYHQSERCLRLPQEYDSASKSNSEESLLSDQGRAVLIGATERCWEGGDRCCNLMASLPYYGTWDLSAAVVLASSATAVSSHMAGDSGIGSDNNSLAASNNSRMDGSIRAVKLPWLSLGGESKSARLNGALSRAEVNGSECSTGIAQWPGMGRNLPASLCPTDLGVGDHLPLVFLSFFLGTGDGEQCIESRAGTVFLSTGDECQ